ncbi:NADP-dependent oxidoreductase [Rhodococcus sp. T7]|uniref:NADP-dependent oxidoreductase n=1 Tax=Rhodococcus sp. T7 TaxID=627444 RepID=UPI00135AA1B0|nr:NADP-dependent oxidoreductase [Rhodococcus sp. T7]KAF0965654.1 putative NADP-dependent oxidoreductase YfmJ [Rhodococcus sp. T7]
MTRTNQAWVLKQRPTAAVEPGDLELADLPVAALEPEQVLIRNVYLSLDPTNRIWMSDRDQYLPPVAVGDVMRGSTIGVVETSTTDRFNPGDVVIPADSGWQRFTVSDATSTSRVRKLDGVPLTAHLSVLGMTGLTAYFGVTDICRPIAGETFVVSAAAGAVGSVAGQIAKIAGARVVGIAGGPEKCRWITEELGFDAAIDYKSQDVGAELDRLCPDGVDMNFENVGGTIMDQVFSRLGTNGRMALCGMISSYNTEGPLAGPRDFGRILMHRLTVRGFVVIDYLPQAKEALQELSEWVRQGRITWKDHVVEGLEEAPAAMERLFRGDHDGKLVVRISDEN